MGWKPNPGHLPRSLRGEDRIYRIHVRLFGGYCTEKKEPNGWAANGRAGCHWLVSDPPHPFEIKEWRLI